MKKLAREIIAELLKADIEVLEKLRETWIEEIKRQGLPDAAVRFCEVALELVIEEKRKGRCSGMNMEFKETGVVEMLKYGKHGETGNKYSSAGRLTG